MATFKQRALTLATVGLLSGSPITVATNGIIQQAEPVVPPVVVPDDRPRVTGGGKTYLDYAPLKRIVTEIRWALDIESTHSYYYQPTVDKHFSSNLFYDLQAETAARHTLWAKATREFVFALDIGADHRFDRLPEIAPQGFSYSVDISSQVVTEQLVRGLYERQIALDAELSGVSRYIPASVDQNVYLNIHLNAVGLDIQSQTWGVPSELSTVHYESSSELSYRLASRHEYHALFESHYSQVSENGVGLDTESYSFVTHAPQVVSDPDEEAIIMLARLLIEDDE